MAEHDFDDISKLVVVHSVTSLQGYLAHKKPPLLRGPPKGLVGIGLLKVPREKRFFMSKVPM